MGATTETFIRNVNEIIFEELNETSVPFRKSQATATAPMQRTIGTSAHVIDPIAMAASQQQFMNPFMVHQQLQHFF